MKKVIVFLIMLVMFSGCADVPIVNEWLTSSPYGFWGGLWHGIVVPFSWIGSLFSHSIGIYAINNNGGWYDFGFIIGIGGIGRFLRFLFVRVFF